MELLTTGNVCFQLKESHDFLWLKDYGNVFSVFDQQDSGNICFGVEKEGKKFFLKYAGARTVNYDGKVESAVAKLHAAVEIYKQLQHPSLVSLVAAIEQKSGFALLFEWLEGENLHPHWEFPPPKKYFDPDSPFKKFQDLNIQNKLQALDTIFEFHCHVEEKGYIAIDLYDGSLMYNFKNSQMKICDIDYYAKRPYKNEIGRMFGSSRFLSPEEQTIGEYIDQKTNVYTMGAMAFCLLGRECKRDFHSWSAAKELSDVATKAVSISRNDRYDTVAQFREAWNKALLASNDQ